MKAISLRHPQHPPMAEAVTEKAGSPVRLRAEGRRRGGQLHCSTAAAYVGLFWFHRAAAAFFAISRRLRGERLEALALPPLSPPLRPAAAFVVSGITGASCA